MNPKTKATFLGLTAILLWSASVAVARSVLERLGIILPTILIYLLGTATLLAYRAIVDKEKPQEVLSGFSMRYILICGSLFVFNMTAFYLALGLANDREATLGVGLINYTWPTVTILLSIPILKRSFNYLLYLGLLVASLGVFAVITHNAETGLIGLIKSLDENALAFLFAAAASLSWGLFSNFTSLLDSGTDKSAVPLFMLATAFALIPLYPFFPADPKWSFIAVLEIIFLGVSNSLGYMFWDWAMRKGDAALVTSVSYLIPFFSSVSICLYFGISAGEKLWWGCALIIIGAYLSKRSIFTDS